MPCYEHNIAPEWTAPLTVDGPPLLCSGSLVGWPPIHSAAKMLARLWFVSLTLRWGIWSLGVWCVWAHLTTPTPTNPHHTNHTALLLSCPDGGALQSADPWSMSDWILAIFTCDLFEHCDTQHSFLDFP